MANGRRRAELLHVLLVLNMALVVLAAQRNQGRQRMLSPDGTGGRSKATGRLGGGRGGESYACPQDLTQLAPARTEPADNDTDPVPATLLMEDTALPIADTDRGMRYAIRLTETSPLSIAITSSCPAGDTAEDRIRWQVMYKDRYIAEMRNESVFYRSCAQRGIYQIVLEHLRRGCDFVVAYNQKGLEEFAHWPFHNLTTPSRIRFQQQVVRHFVLVKWEKSKLDIHAMSYCLAVSTGGPQRSLCQAIGNSMLKPNCHSILVNEYLHRLGPHDERKVDSGADTTVVCTGGKTKQLIRGMKPNVTYYVDVFAIHTQRNNISFLLGSTQVRFNRTRPTQLLEGKVIVGKLSVLGGVSQFSFKMPKRSTNSFFRLHITPCGGSLNIEIMKKRPRVLELIRDVYYPRIVTVKHVYPGERYLIRVTEGEESARLSRVQIAVTSKPDFIDLPRMPSNTTVVELVPLRKCHSSTIAWFAAPEKNIAYCVYVFRLSKTKYYNNVKIPTYCDLESCDVCNHPQFHNKHCFNGNNDGPLSLELTNLVPEHYYSVFVTAVPQKGRRLPYKSVRIKTASYCTEKELAPTVELDRQVQNQRGHKRRQTGGRQNSLGNTEKRSFKNRIQKN